MVHAVRAKSARYTDKYTQYKDLPLLMDRQIYMKFKAVDAKSKCVCVCVCVHMHASVRMCGCMRVCVEHACVYFLYFFFK